MKTNRYLLILFPLLLLGCGISNAASDTVTNVANDDLEMNAAIQMAQETLDFFIADLNAPKPSQTYFSVKVRFPTDDEGSAEHIWLDGVSYIDGQFQGTIGNEVYYVPDLEYGDFVQVPREQISDWVIIEAGRLVGGYTIRVLYCRMTQQEQNDFLEQGGFVIQEPCPVH